MKTTTLKQGKRMLELFEDTPADQTQALLKSGLLTDVRDANFLEMTPGTREEIRRLLGFKKSILAFLDTIVVISATKKFVVKDNFRVGKAGIGYLGDNFMTWFLGKTEEPAPETTLCYHRLTESSFDAPILAELGGKAETTLANLFYLLSLQAKGQKGALLTNGYANIFYVRDANGELRAVGARWRAFYGDWGVGARGVAGPFGWRAGSQVFSRNS